jgi:hypothetical protein
MDVLLLKRPVLGLFSGRNQCLIVAANAMTLRHESSYRRTKKLLNIKPNDTFVFSKSPSKLDSVVFNPPSSSPSVLHTPLTFLPKDDKRRQLFANAATSTLAHSPRLPPIIKPKPITYQRHHLTEEDVEEMRRLRKLDPDRWTVSKLGRKFNCTSFFVQQCTSAPEHRQKKIDAMEAAKAREGPRRKKAKEDRKRRWEMVMRDE